MTAGPREDVSYCSDGDLVRAWYYPRAGGAPAACPAVVFCPGFTGTKYAAFYEPYVERFAANGIAVLLIDYRGWGDSDGPRGEIVPLRQVADIRNGLDYLQTRTDVDGYRLGVFGVSFGGGNAVYAAAVDARVRACVAVSPVGDGARWMRSMRREYEWHALLDDIAADRRERCAGRPARQVDPTEGILVSTPERRATTVKGNVPAGKLATSTPLWCAESVLEYRPVALASAISPRALLLFYVERDAVVPGEQSEAIYAAAGEPKQLVRLPGTGHYSAYVEHLETISGQSLHWLAIHLGVSATG